MAKKSEYNAKDISVLKGLDPVRKRPGMYIGSTDKEGLHHLIWECADNFIDEFMGGHGSQGEVVLHADDKVEVNDDGRGIPVDKHKETGRPAVETVMTTLHAGAKFGSKAYQVSGGLHGVGISVVCALSEWMRVEVSRDGYIHHQEYERGVPKGNLKKGEKTNKTGTRVIFKPDKEIFKDASFSSKKIISHLRQQAYLTKGIKITFKDKRKEQEENYSFYFEGGISSYVKFLTRGIDAVHPNVFYCTGEKEGVLIEAAFRYSQEYEIYEESFANNINTTEGGAHLTGFRVALTKTINNYAKREGLLKEADDNLRGEDVREGITGVVSVKIQEPQFEGQTKAKLGNAEARSATEFLISEHLIDFFERNPQDARAIIGKCILSAKARKAARAVRETVLRKGVLEGLSLPGKLSDCSSRNPEESELYIVEGESAGGCFSGETEIALADGRNVSFKQLIEEHRRGKSNYCYTIKEDGSVGIGLVKHPRKTKKNVEVIKVVLDNEEEITCTPDHKFMLRDGSYKRAENLTSEDSLMPLRKKLSELGNGITIEGYEMVFDNKESKWIFTHLLADKYNLENNIDSIKNGSQKHHKDFNKLNNSPENIERMTKEDHMNYHRKMTKYGIHKEEAKEKSKNTRQTKEYREKIRKKMTTPEMREMLSRRAKKQWEDENYKKYMAKKFLDFYKSDSTYREINRKMLNENQKKYWAEEENRKKQAKRIKDYFEDNPEEKEKLTEKAKKQWTDKSLLEWRAQETKKQWTSDFREKRKKSYNETYRKKALELLKEVYRQNGFIGEEEYQKERRKRKDMSILKYETICKRFFEGSEKRMEEAVVNYNHRIKKIERDEKRMDVYDIEVDKTHNFALASGVFVHNSCKGARDRRFQAILPLKGKILNVERYRLNKVLESKEVKALVIALGTAIAEDFDIEKLRYQRIIIMCDADSDGNHIKTLLLTLFFRHFRPLIEKGYLYIARPPLYKIQAGKRIEYAYTEEDKAESLQDIKSDSVDIQRYKGLGEMNPDQLWETTMNPENRMLLQVNIEDAKDADRIFDALMGQEVSLRKNFIKTHAKEVGNLDI